MSPSGEPKSRPRGLVLLAIYVATGGGGLLLARFLVRAFRGYPPWMLPATVIGLLALLLIVVFIVAPRLSRRA
jgi:hypothetical protein